MCSGPLHGAKSVKLRSLCYTITPNYTSMYKVKWKHKRGSMLMRIWESKYNLLELPKARTHTHTQR